MAAKKGIPVWVWLAGGAGLLYLAMKPAAGPVLNPPVSTTPGSGGTVPVGPGSPANQISPVSVTPVAILPVAPVSQSQVTSVNSQPVLNPIPAGNTPINYTPVTQAPNNFVPAGSLQPIPPGNSDLLYTEFENNDYPGANNNPGKAHYMNAGATSFNPASITGNWRNNIY